MNYARRFLTGVIAASALLTAGQLRPRATRIGPSRWWCPLRRGVRLM